MESSSKEKINLDLELISEIQISSEYDEDDDVKKEEIEAIENLSDDDEDEDEEEFSFIFGGANTSPIAAEDAFIDGQIKSFYPLFKRDLLLSDLPINPPVKKVFVETSNGNYEQVTSSTPENDEINGPYCEWSNSKTVEVEAEASSPEVCKKSNSTGFSKIWRFKDFLGRSNSDGRDAFVFLNNDQSPPSSEADQPPVEVVVVKKDEPIVNVIKKVKKVSKGKTASLSALEVYMRSKAKEAERRRSYLPYRPQITGFFTNVTGGLTKNVHPF